MKHCQTHRKALPVAPLHPCMVVASKPWARLHVDYAGPFEGKMFFVMIDAYSK